MSCSRCSSEDLYQFEASPKVKVTAAPLPLVCRGCGLISIGGEPVNLPEELERQALSLAEAATVAGRKTREELEQDKDVRIEKYFESVYRQAYLDGFFRSVSFYQHFAKEGRLGRVRLLWEKFDIKYDKGRRVVSLKASARVYDEVDSLLNFGHDPEKLHAESPSHKHSTNEEGTPRVP